jgi:hypothetical protein
MGENLASAFRTGIYPSCYPVRNQAVYRESQYKHQHTRYEQEEAVNAYVEMRDSDSVAAFVRRTERDGRGPLIRVTSRSTSSAVSSACNFARLCPWMQHALRREFTRTVHTSAVFFRDRISKAL